MEVAKIQVGGTCACAYEKKNIRAGMVGVTVSFAFDEYWDGLNKIAVYRCGGVTRDEYLEGDTGTIPAEVLTKSGFDLEIGVYGTDAEKQIAIPTCWANLGVVRPGADPSGDPAADPELPFWAKVQEWLKTRFVKTVNGIGADENGNVEIEAGKVDVDPTLTAEGLAADAKAVGDALDEKAPVGMFINLSWAGETDVYQADCTLTEVHECYQNGGRVVIHHYTGRYECVSTSETAATFNGFYVSDTAVTEATASMDSEGIVRISRNLYVNKVDTARTVDDGNPQIGQILAVKKVNFYNRIEEYETVDLPKGTMVVNLYFDWGTRLFTADKSGTEICQHIADGGTAILNGDTANGRASGYFTYQKAIRDGADYNSSCPVSLGDCAVFHRTLVSSDNKGVCYVFLVRPDKTVEYLQYETSMPIENLNAEPGYVLTVDKVRGSSSGNMPNTWKYVPMPKAITIDPTLSIEGQAADAKAVGDALADKAKKPLIINADDAPTTGNNSVSGIPIFTIDYTPADLKAYADAGGSVTIVRYNRHYAMYDATEETAKFRFIEATDMQVDWYHAVLDANGAVSITKTTHKSRMETTTGGTVGQIPIIKSLDSKGRPSTWEFVGITDILPVYNGEVGEA